jgi:hypothetical protein
MVVLTQFYISSRRFGIDGVSKNDVFLFEPPLYVAAGLVGSRLISWAREGVVFGVN